ncbi:hypothetical protein ACFFUB_03400 [Algimonas porphyrae]|uniref:Uncharacterized protein n=1 Tax=Algimonas porphyrae TaxID=1128113 RepID=A0ABQ5UYG2_9PROT|nr:hypothetical protein [Algimonas porphyrae]GLQ20188.1 hypothetical protein GCM10007854_11430 [Algimonas porphyrae]
MRALILSLSCLTVLSACQTVPDDMDTSVNIDVPEMRTCTPMSALQRVEIPAVTRTFTAITEIENEPYEPIQKKETIVREIEPARVVFLNSAGAEVTDICETEINPSGMTSEGSF